MLGRLTHFSLPRKVAAVFTMAGLIAILWTLGVALATLQGMVVDAEFESRLAGARRYAVRARSHLHDADALAEALQGIRAEGPFDYVALVGPDGKYLAHTRRDQVGRLHTETAGREIQRAGLTGWMSQNGKSVEFATPVRDAQKQPLGELRLGMATATPVQLVGRAGSALSLLAAAPLVLLLGGAWLTQRMLRPISELEQQVREAAAATTPSEAALREIPRPAALAAGWSHIVDWLREAEGQSQLSARLEDAVAARRETQSTDILNSLTEGVAVTNAEGRVTLANTAMCVVLTGEADCGGVLEQQLIDLLELPSLAPDCPLLDPQRINRHVVVELDQPRDPEPVVLRIGRSPLRTAQASGAGHVWTVRDVTQQKLADRMRSQFLDSATHELRTPLANIRAYAETLANMDEIDVESQKTFCNTINAEAARLARFIDDLLSISSMEVGSMSLGRSNCDIERLLGEAVEKIAGHADQKNIVVRTVLPPKYPKMKLDKDKMQVALVNLLGNAVKYTPEGGNVTLRVKVDGDTVQIEVEDTGVGISEEELPRVFDKFFRSESSEVQSITGTGLGLSMCQEIVRLHGGELSVDSTLGAGSTFTVLLPIDRTE